MNAGNVTTTAKIWLTNYIKKDNLGQLVNYLE